MFRLLKFSGLALAALAASVVPSSAHTGLGDHGGIVQGLMHPVSGLDHLLAMVAVGAVATQLNGRLRFGLPLMFMALLAVGSLLGLQGTTLPQLEFGIGASVVLMGILIAHGGQLPKPVMVVLVGVFALFHGNAHGAELPIEVSANQYMIGIMLATGLLLVSGFGFGRLLESFGRAGLVRLAGISMMLIGVGLAA
jgi:urease accessory protein